MDPTIQRPCLVGSIIVGNDLKAIQEFDIKTLKQKDLWTVCGILKIKGVSIYKLKEQCWRLTDNSNFNFAATRKEPHCH